ncbi:ExeM/NucH family extracellular endonuclease [Bowmanella dokdonensis]|uniref:ExeM/NucH family extracellular endonuclease n=1 Tax=Bowmanella dokdonensis TaxID=751969 RepID=A0A939DLU1_9ALTE|nr:ExeM/NucH family extracellular endonuclease [Bowmanella dokdonensis]MBN7825123.1 ExeM/NucH family extracellular endonuclease [Bowmanella dokdonensis]
MKTKLTLLSVAIVASMQANSAPADSLILTGVIDGPLTGGVPKAVELYVAKDIEDLSQCGVGFANNGGGTDGEEFSFPAQAVPAGTYLYVASEATGFGSFFGFAPDFVTGHAAINGDDAIEVYCDGAVVDTFGELSVDGSGTAWDYLDGWASRLAGTGPDGSAFVISNWALSGINVLDGAVDNTSAATPFPLKTYGPETNPGDGGGDGGVDGSVCFNCPDLDKVADAGQFSDSQYYAQVMAALNDNYSAAEVKTLLTDTISNNHRVLSYAEVWTALTETDEDPQDSDKVTLLYKGTSLAKSLNGSGSQSSDPDNWNREHVWPNSHGFSSQSFEAYTDIHHLRPTDISVNASRGNLDFDNSDAPLAEAPQNRIDSDSFEPRDAVKGDVARMMFYMDVRYEGADVTPDLQLVDRLTGPGEPALGRLCRLLAWHEADPVDNMEQQRNASIYEYQGNRNPFIDHPEWVEVLYDADSCDGNGDGGDNGSPDPVPGEAGLIFSEYVEGDGGNNKAIELFNATGTSLDLSGYQVLLYSNGATSTTNSLDLQGTLASGGVYVIANSGSNAEILAVTDTTSSVTFFNGNDVLELRKNGLLVDSIGQVGNGSNFAANVTWVRKPGIVSGDTDSSDAFDASVEWDSLGTNVFSNLGSHDGGNGGGETPVVQLGQCTEPATLISQIQGEGASSPLKDQTQVIEAVVTASFPALKGYFVQEEVADHDGSSATSEGLFVYQNSEQNLPVAGTLVRVIGNVSEYFDKTQLTAAEQPLDCGQAQVQAVSLSLPFADATHAESLEGMLVSFNQELTVTDNYNLGRYGEVTLSYGRTYIPTNLHLPGSPEAQALAMQNALNRVLLDDGINGQNPQTVIYPTGGLSAGNSLRTGDSVTSLTGVLDYGFNEYRVIPTAAPTFVASNPRTPEPELAEGNLSVASINVLNLFNGDGQGGGFPTSRGADNAEEYERQLTKLVSALVAMDADILGLMEIENDGFGANSAIAQLTDAINERLGEEAYAFINAGGPLGTDEITVGLLYKPATTAPLGNALVNSDPVFNRPALAQRFKALGSGGDFAVIVNHFKSKGSCGGATSGDQDQGDGQGCWNQARQAQAQTLIDWLATAPELSADTDHLVIGDLNSYAKEDPIRVFTDNGYINLIEHFEGAGAYSYAFGGEVGYLDHAIGSASLLGQVVDVTEWHINADEPRILDYNTEYKSEAQINDFYAPDAYRVSDHDPVLVSLYIKGLRGDFDADGDVDVNDMTGLLRALAKKQQVSMDFDLNEDGVVNVRDAQIIRTLCTRQGCKAN